MPGEFSCCPQDFQRVYKVCRLSGNDADSDEEDNDYMMKMKMKTMMKMKTIVAVMMRNC